MRRAIKIIFAALSASIVLSVSSALPASADDQTEVTTNHDSRTMLKDPVIYRQEAVIYADKAYIWHLISDFSTYKDWNPFVPKVVGKLEEGAKLSVKVRLGGRTMKFKHTVRTVEHESKFCWEDAGWNSWFVSAHRCRTLESLPDGGVLLRQEVAIDGGLIDVADIFMGAQLREGVAGETAALKRYAEENTPRTVG